MPSISTEVLVIGGGPVGLSTALHLNQQGVDCVLVEKHPSTATHPKASYFNVRTMELLRQLGAADDVYATALMPTGVSFYTRLCGFKLGVLGAADYPDHVERVLRSTASPGWISSQVVLEGDPQATLRGRRARDAALPPREDGDRAGRARRRRHSAESRSW
jgi:2-polyprenyl-6-methoxyphenol hydroxylase-like FAD-dependent oxidoreductase